MTSYPIGPTGSTGRGEDAARPLDPRLDAFVGWLRALDDRDWRGGIESTRALRKLGISVVLCPSKPPGDRRPA